MTLTLGRAIGLSAWLAGALVAFGCQSIVGIEDRTFDACGEKCETCEEYCALTEANCTGDFALYKDHAACLGTCNALPLGDLREPGRENTIACRMEQAENAGRGEPNVHCSGAGPAGGNLCGSDCESYCYLFATVCEAEFDSDAECRDKCRALRDDPAFDVNSYYDTDTVECRIIHITNATVDPIHCGHAEFQSSLHCDPPDMAPVSCVDYCRVAMVACEGENSVYDDNATCLAVCAALEPGSNLDEVENTVGCRHYHSYNSIHAPATHCSHAGPGGAGHCGEIEGGAGNCESYCRLAKAGCDAQFTATFGTDAACLEACADIPGAANVEGTSVNETEQYSIALAESDDPAFAFQCRLLHTTRAITQGGSPQAECDAVFGVAGSACQPVDLR